MKRKQYPYEVNILGKRVNRLRKRRQPSQKRRQLFPAERVNLFRIDSQNVPLSHCPIVPLRRLQSGEIFKIIWLLYII